MLAIRPAYFLPHSLLIHAKVADEAVLCRAKGSQALSAGTAGKQSSALRLSHCTHRVEILFLEVDDL